MEKNTIITAYLIDFCPESLLQLLLCLPQSLCAVEHVKVGEDAHHLGESVRLEDVEKLERLHLKTKAGINQKKNLKK